MTLKEILGTASVMDDQAADAAYALHAGERQVRVEINDDSDKLTHPAILWVDDYPIKLTTCQAHALASVAGAALLDRAYTRRTGEVAR